MIRSEALAIKNMRGLFTEVLYVCMKILYNMKIKQMQSRIFIQTCEKFGAEHQNLLLYAEVRWLSGLKVIKRVVESRKEFYCFYSENNCNFSIFF